MESGYLCYYCNEIFYLFKDIFNHLIEKHNAETFKIKKLKFCEIFMASVPWLMPSEKRHKHRSKLKDLKLLILTEYIIMEITVLLLKLSRHQF
jgi:hypothetical protein